MSNDTLTIAKTIKQQIGTNTLMCIAANSFFALPESDKSLGGLTFRVGRNPKMKQGGIVTVNLDFNDTYTVKIVSARGKTLLDQSGVYCDQLGGQGGVIEGVTG
jgi:hypothetical protein